MRIAVLADIHGNLPALQAVLAELDAERVDAIVSAGDLMPGPLPAECLAALRAWPVPVHWVTGNGDRDAAAVKAGRGPKAGEATEILRHAAAQLTDNECDDIASWPASVIVGDVCVCHGSPRDVDEVLTRDTPTDVLVSALAGVDAQLVVGGHTHQQMVRALDTGPDYANAGSVGLPYEGDAAAFWLLVEGSEPQLRRTAYDVEAAIAVLGQTDYPGLDDVVDGALGPLADPAWVAAFFEHGAGRGDDPGPVIYLR